MDSNLRQASNSCRATLISSRRVTTKPLLCRAIPSPEASTSDPRALNVPEAFRPLAEMIVLETV